MQPHETASENGNGYGASHEHVAISEASARPYNKHVEQTTEFAFVLKKCMDWFWMNNRLQDVNLLDIVTEHLDTELHEQAVALIRGLRIETRGGPAVDLDGLGQRIIFATLKRLIKVLVSDINPTGFPMENPALASGLGQGKAPQRKLGTWMLQQCRSYQQDLCPLCRQLLRAVITFLRAIIHEQKSMSCMPRPHHKNGPKSQAFPYAATTVCEVLEQAFNAGKASPRGAGQEFPHFAAWMVLSDAVLSNAFHPSRCEACSCEELEQLLEAQGGWAPGAAAASQNRAEDALRGEQEAISAGAALVAQGGAEDEAEFDAREPEAVQAAQGRAETAQRAAQRSAPAQRTASTEWAGVRQARGLPETTPVAALCWSCLQFTASVYGALLPIGLAYLVFSSRGSPSYLVNVS